MASSKALFHIGGHEVSVYSGLKVTSHIVVFLSSQRKIQDVLFNYSLTFVSSRRLCYLAFPFKAAT